MRKFYITSFFLFVVCFISLISLNSNTEEQKNTSLYTKNKFFVKTYRELKVSEATGEISVQTGILSIDNLNKKYGIKKIKNIFRLDNGSADLFEELGMSRIYIFYLDEKNRDIAEATKEYNSDLNIEYSEPNFIGYGAGERDNESIPNDEMFSKQWYLMNSGLIRPTSGGSAKVGADINITKAWDIESGSDDIIIAILDSGVGDDHPDLKGKMWINTKEIPNNGIDDDHNGYIDDYKGWDFAYESNNTKDGFGHGTNIASVIGAKSNNSIGCTGMTFKSRLMNCKNLSDDNSGEYEWWAKSLKYAVDNGARIINMSEGGADYSNVLKTAVEYAIKSGALVSAAMMNKANNNDYYPAAFKGVFAVGATDSDDKRCRKFSWGGGSCWGKHISVVAPGNKIYGLDYNDFRNTDLYWSGTSQSTAMVSGLAALLLSQNQNRTAEDIKKIIIATADDQVGDISEDRPGWDQYYGYGRINCYNALTYGSDYKTEKTEKNKYEENQEQTEQEYNKTDKKAKSVPENKAHEPVREKEEKYGPAKKK